MALSKEQIIGRLARIERDEPSAVFGGDLRIRELTRAEYRTVARGADLGENRLDLDRWNAGLFVAGVINGNSEPMFALDEVLAWPQRDTIWTEVQRIAEAILNLSEVGPEALTKSSPTTDNG
jgi:hypothetical protein